MNKICMYSVHAEVIGVNVTRELGVFKSRTMAESLAKLFNNTVVKCWKGEWGEAMVREDEYDVFADEYRIPKQETFDDTTNLILSAINYGYGGLV